MSKARFSVFCRSTALACIAISCPVLAQTQSASPPPPDTAPPANAPAPQPNLGAPNETTVESDKVTQGVAQAPAGQGVLQPIIVTAQKRREKIQDVGIS